MPFAFEVRLVLPGRVLFNYCKLLPVHTISAIVEISAIKLLEIHRTDLGSDRNRAHSEELKNETTL